MGGKTYRGEGGNCFPRGGGGGVLQTNGCQKRDGDEESDENTLWPNSDSQRFTRDALLD